ncbi:MAG: hypothetical protein CVV13_11805 [Gammaproteobacteria bacterium HGW-Gammaproteobacteria-3]|nr:MAG: hypothetical protein CVV13_11805 [Gammaproteobacteria bacterium HGW-Gammaproteobacteria-3]
MADSKQQTNRILPEDFADDLDAMLDEAASSPTDAEALMNDDDAIDSLLLANALEDGDAIDNDDDDFDTLFSDNSTDFKPEVKVEQVFQKIDANESEAAMEVDEFAEIDEFADDPVLEASIRQEPERDVFTVAEFDISNDEETIESVNAALGENQKTVQDSVQQDHTVSSEASPETVDTSAKTMDPAMSAQINQLSSDQAALKQRLEEVAASIAAVVPVANNASQDEIDRLTKAQEALKKKIEAGSSGKMPVIAYSALGVALTALVMVIIFGYIGWSSNEQEDELVQQIATLEENQEGIIAKNAIIDDLNTKIEQQSQTLTGLNEQVSAWETVKAEFSESQTRQKTLNEAVTGLADRLKRLEVKKPLKTSQKAVTKPRQTKTWSVNLVSFRQKWYADEKAAEFAKKGLAPKVVAVKVKGETWYRLTVDGFKNKTDASAFAAQARKNFNLDSVWLGKN